MPENMMTLQRRRPLRIYAEAFAVTKPLPTNEREYALALEESTTNQPLGLPAPKKEEL